MTQTEQALLPQGATSSAVETAVGQWEKIQILILDPNNLLILFLLAFGIMLKNSHKVPDWLIIFIVPAFGALIGLGLFSMTLHQTQPLVAAMLGFVYGVFATFAHQLAKQVLGSPAGKPLLKIPGMTILAALIGAEIVVEDPKPEQPKP